MRVKEELTDLFIRTVQSDGLEPLQFSRSTGMVMEGKHCLRAPATGPPPVRMLCLSLRNHSRASFKVSVESPALWTLSYCITEEIQNNFLSHHLPGYHPHFDLISYCIEFHVRT